MKVIQKIVITGGPCAGKSTAMSWIRNAFTQRGYTVLIIPETYRSDHSRDGDRTDYRRRRPVDLRFQ